VNKNRVLRIEIHDAAAREDGDWPPLEGPSGDMAAEPPEESEPGPRVH
jgi:hypothetical protein